MSILNKIFKKSKPNIKDLAIKSLYSAIKDYSVWYANHGLYLPPDYATDPGKWTMDLQGIERAFRLLKEESEGRGELYEAKNKWKQFGETDTEKINDLEKEIKKSLKVFGEELLYLTDEGNTGKYDK